MGVTYYDTGTATLSVGSKTMTGQGTLWAGWVKPGDQVIPQDGTNNVVDVVVSNTEITLLKPYRGVAQAAQPYTVMRTPDAVFTESLARETFQQINDSTLVALAEMTPAARVGFRLGPTMVAETFPFSDKAVEFLGKNGEPAMRDMLNVAPKQANAVDGTAGAGLIVGGFGLGWNDGLQAPGVNLNSLGATQFLSASDATPAGWNSALGTYPMGFHVQRSSVAQAQFAVGFNGEAGFRAKVDNTNWQAWRKLFHTHNVRGPVSQSGGIPTGSLIESGSNSSGFYERYAGGLQICWMQDLTFGPVATAAGPIFSGAAEQTFSFPAAFSNSGSVDCHAMSDSTNIWGVCSVPSATAVRVQLFCFSSIGSSRKVNIIAHGKWF